LFSRSLLSLSLFHHGGKQLLLRHVFLLFEHEVFVTTDPSFYTISNVMLETDGSVASLALDFPVFRTVTIIAQDSGH
jgi:hypothetical protein